MKLKGTLVGVIRDAETGKVKRTFSGTNHIQDWFLRALAGPGTDQLKIPSNLFISDTNPGQQRRDWPQNIPNVVGGDDISGVDKRVITYNHSPGVHLAQYIQRFSAPAQDYTIHMAGLCNYVNGSTTNGGTTVVWLSTPCIQTTTETLDLYYRVQLLFDPNWKDWPDEFWGINGWEAQQLARHLFGSYTGYLIPDNFSAPRTTPLCKYNPRKLAAANLFTEPQNALAMQSITHDSDYDNFKKGWKLSRDITAEVGKLIGGLFVSENNSPPVLGERMMPLDSNPIQSVFGHRNTSTTPFYSAASAQLGLGQLTVNGDAWTNPDFPKYMRVDIETTGGVGVGGYKFRMRNHFGFKNNTFVNTLNPLPFSDYTNGHYINGNFSWARDDIENITTALLKTSGVLPTPYDGNKVLLLWNNEIAVADALTGEGDAITNSTVVGTDVAPNFQASDISQVAVQPNKDFFVSCRNTGLYHLNAALDTLTVINSSTPGLTGVLGCKAVCIGNGGRIWTYWDHATTPDIYYSDDNGASWTAAGYSDVFVDANASNVVSIKADPNDAGGKIGMLVYDDNTADTQSVMIKWWDHALTTASDGVASVYKMTRVNTYKPIMTLPGHNYHLNNLLECSPNDSTWAISARKDNINGLGYPTFFTFGTAADNKQNYQLDIGTRVPHTIFKTDAAGNDALFYISAAGQTDISTDNVDSYIVLYSTDASYEAHGTVGTSPTSFDGDYALMYMHDGVWLGVQVYPAVSSIQEDDRNFYFLFSAVPDAADIDHLPALRDELYPEYGWNGVAWERGHAGERTIHATVEELIDGVTIAFDDNAGAAPFLDSDHYTFGVCNGVWLDGSTSFDYSWELYSKPTYQSTAVESATLPGTTKVSNQILEFETDQVSDYQDLVSTDTNNLVGLIQATGTGLEGDYSAGGRSLDPAIRGDATSFLPNSTWVPGSDVNNAQGWIEFALDMAASFHIESYMGVSPSSVLGTALDASTIAHAIHADSVTPGNGVGTCTLRVVESGIERATVTDVPYSTTTSSAYGRIILLTNGSVRYEYRLTSTGQWYELYTSPPGSVTIENMYLDFNYVPRSNYGWNEVSHHYLDTSNPDYYLYLGDGIDQGVFDPEFYKVDQDTIQVTIDGAPAVHIGVDDQSTVLPANTYSLYQNAGVIRYSVDDIGKAVTAQYVTILNE